MSGLPERLDLCHQLCHVCHVAHSDLDATVAHMAKSLERAGHVAVAVHLHPFTEPEPPARGGERLGGLEVFRTVLVPKGELYVLNAERHARALAAARSFAS